ncbi:hypothetical protein [Treponema lecithinolyticum]|uniref:DUF624 domain-containing protein n=1 Tax=Treponema lecithinolyticum ATCC 700332 TaxID=1321815 RepID=A0ABN0P0Z9_TRELE|nr:hypothetical protein [Treponema lecithinolyticum]ERJ94091.1 hypothetical protein HMPREF9193_00446 [Treponema lecithinolyticum ATCC 700332]
MILFFLKKNFCDGWDNLLYLVLFNLILLALFAGLYFALSLLISVSVPLALLVSAVSVCILMIPLFALSDSCARLADFKSVSVKETFAAFSAVWKDAVLFGLLVQLLVFMGAVALPFYFGMKNILGLVLGSLIFWILVVCVLSFQWFMPLRSRFGGGFRKNIKKCFAVFFDNALFSVFMFIYSLVLFVLSGLVAFMAPGAAGVILGYNNALRLRVYKYDWLETHRDIPPKEARRSIPWDELLGEDRETLGPRDLKSFIFPWK